MHPDLRSLVVLLDLLPDLRSLVVLVDVRPEPRLPLETLMAVLAFVPPRQCPRKRTCELAANRHSQRL